MGITFKIGGLVTLLFDAYLLLSMMALARMKNMYHHWLPPLGWEFAQSLPSVVVVMIVFWTGFLAVGCITGHKGPKSLSPNQP